MKSLIFAILITSGSVSAQSLNVEDAKAAYQCLRFIDLYHHTVYEVTLERTLRDYNERFEEEVLAFPSVLRQGKTEMSTSEIEFILNRRKLHWEKLYKKVELSRSKQRELESEEVFSFLSSDGSLKYQLQYSGEIISTQVDHRGEAEVLKVTQLDHMSKVLLFEQVARGLVLVNRKTWPGKLKFSAQDSVEEKKLAMAVVDSYMNVLDYCNPYSEQNGPLAAFTSRFSDHYINSYQRVYDQLASKGVIDQTTFLDKNN